MVEGRPPTCLQCCICGGCCLTAAWFAYMTFSHTNPPKGLDALKFIPVGHKRHLFMWHLGVCCLGQGCVKNYGGTMYYLTLEPVFRAIAAFHLMCEHLFSVCWWRLLDKGNGRKRERKDVINFSWRAFRARVCSGPTEHTDSWATCEALTLALSQPDRGI